MVEEMDGFDYDDVPEPPKVPVVKAAKAGRKETPKPPRAHRSEEVEEALDPEEGATVINDGRNIRIDTPAGKCPHALTGLDEKTVFEWTEKIRGTGVKNARWYSKKALKYWVRAFYDIHSKEHQDAIDMIENVCCE